MMFSSIGGFCFAILVQCKSSKSDKLKPSLFEKYTQPRQLPHEIECALNFHPLQDSDSDSSQSPEEDHQDRLPNGNSPFPSSQDDFVPESFQKCECVPFYQCTDNKTISQNGEDMLDVRSAFLSGIGLVSNPPYKPCPCTNASTNPRPGGSSGVCENFLDVCCRPPEVLSDEALTPPSTEVFSECVRLITSGFDWRFAQAEQYSEFPWAVEVLGNGIINGRKDRSVYLCGGSLVRPNVVLTAAHCVKGRSGLLVHAGVRNKQVGDEIHPMQERNIDHVTIHEDYYAGALHNDIALLFLELPVQLSTHVAPVCLPQQGETMDNRVCMTSGRTNNILEREGIYQNKKKIELPVVQRDSCEEKLRSTRLGRYFHLHESFLCAGGQIGIDTCKGDGGSPLVCPDVDDPSVYVQAGIVSWGIGCGGDTPGVYVNVPNFRAWIDKKVEVMNAHSSHVKLEGR